MPNLYSAIITLVSILSMAISTQTLANTADKKPGAIDQQPSHYWYDGHRKQVLWQATNELVVHAAPGKGRSAQPLPHIAHSLISEATVIHGNQSWVHLKLNTQALTRNAQSLSKNRTKNLNNLISAVYYADDDGYTGLHIATAELLLHFHQAMSVKQAQQWGQTQDLSLVRPLNLDQAYLFRCNQPENCLQLANQLYHQPQVKYAYPNWIRPKAKRHSDLFNPNDTLFNQQWYLDNQGQTNGTAGEDLNLLTAWTQGHGSRDEIIAIVDDGVEIAHEDLQDNIINELCWDFIDNDNNPTSVDQTHGTWAAGIAAARGGNSLGITGVAPHAGLVGFRLLDGGESVSNQAEALTRNYHSIDIYSNSWGPADDAHLEGLDPLTEAALIDGVNNGRNGKGVIYVWAGGNGQARLDNSNYDGYANSPYTLAIAASTHTGIQAPYSENGANIWVNAPSSNSGSVNVITTNLQGTGNVAENYTNNFGGTSAVTPQVAGVAALMLEQNPALGWRDVQRILAETAEKNDPQDSDWVENGAGLSINHKYGFGRVDAEAAVNAAKTWTLASPQLTTHASITLTDVIIPDNDATGISTTLNVHENLEIEYVELTFSSDHSYWGDLEIILTSPSGTQNVLAETNAGSGGAAYSNGWRFGIARLLGEHAQGQWTLTIKDQTAKDTGNINSWSLKVYGTPASPPIEFGVISLDHNWQTITLKSSFADPVVIISPLTFNGGQPAVVRMQDVQNNQFQLRIQEWLYLNQLHVTESVAYLVVEKGRHQLADGSIWEAGTFAQSGTGQWLPLRLDASAKLFITLQSFNGKQTVTPRARSESPLHSRSTPLIPNPNNGSHLFYTALFEEEALMDGHKPESVGYLAITAGSDSPQIRINRNLTSYTLSSAMFTDSWTSASKAWQLKLEEETSADTETRHLAESISLLTINDYLFAQDMSSHGSNTIGIRLRPDVQ